MSVKIDRSEFDKLLQEMPEVVAETWQAAGKRFRALTPIKSGNARRRTRVDNKGITADYAYAERLDTGLSKQAPRGMSTETQAYFETLVKRRLGDL